MTDLDWISYRATQSFPLADQVSGISQQGVAINDSLLLDLMIYIPQQFQVDHNQFYLKEIKQQQNTITLIIGYKGQECLISSGIPKTIGMTNTISDRYFILAPVASQNFEWFFKLTGSVTLGNTIEYTEGTLSFDLNNARLNRSCIIVLDIKKDKYIQSITVGDDVLTGNITLEAGQGILIDVIYNDKDSLINISLDPQFIQQKMKQKLQVFGTPIRTINSKSPDANGNININGTDCVSVNTVGIGTLTISNPCSKPCCGSEDIENLEASLQIVKGQQDVLKQYYVNMANNINYMQSNLSTLMSN